MLLNIGMLWKGRYYIRTANLACPEEKVEVKIAHNQKTLKTCNEWHWQCDEALAGAAARGRASRQSRRAHRPLRSSSTPSLSKHSRIEIDLHVSDVITCSVTYDNVLFIVLCLVESDWCLCFVLIDKKNKVSINFF